MGQKPKIALMTYAIDNRAAKGTAIVARYSTEKFLELKDTYDLTFIHYEKCTDPIYQHGVKEIIIPEWRWMNFRSLRQIWFFLTTKEQFDCMVWFQPRLYPFFWLAPARKIFVTLHGAGNWGQKDRFEFGAFMYLWTIRLWSKYIDLGTGGSEYARNDIIEKYKFDPKHVALLHYGADERFERKGEDAIQKIREKYGLPPTFILNVARYVYTKNAHGVIKAFDQYMTKHPDSDLHLVNIGGKSVDTERVMHLYNTSRWKDRIHLIEYVEVEELPIFYSACLALVFPLMDEGFGLPAIEAMRCKCPVVVANTAYPEITNDTGLLVNAYDPNDIERGIKTIVEDRELRERIAEAGYHAAQKYTWKNYGDKLVKLVDDLIKTP